MYNEMWAIYQRNQCKFGSNQTKTGTIFIQIIAICLFWDFSKAITWDLAISRMELQSIGEACFVQFCLKLNKNETVSEWTIKSWCTHWNTVITKALHDTIWSQVNKKGNFTLFMPCHYFNTNTSHSNKKDLMNTK